MPAQFSAEEIMDIAEARLAAGMMHDQFGAICADTRRLCEGDWFVALPGDRFDGHDFLGDAFAQGAAGAIVEERTAYPLGNQQFPLLAVDDPGKAYRMLAKNWRRRINPYVIAVTGSSGKTATVQMGAAILSGTFRCHMSRGDDGGRWSVFDTMLSMADDTQMLLLEVRAEQGRTGEESGLTELAAACILPDVVVVTALAGSGDDVVVLPESGGAMIREVAQLAAKLRADRGLAIAGLDDSELVEAIKRVFGGPVVVRQQSSVSGFNVDDSALRFRSGSSDVEFVVECRAPGDAAETLQAAWCAVEIARHVKIADSDIAFGLTKSRF